MAGSFPGGGSDKSAADTKAAFLKYEELKGKQTMLNNELKNFDNRQDNRDKIVLYTFLGIVGAGVIYLLVSMVF